MNDEPFDPELETLDIEEIEDFPAEDWDDTFDDGTQAEPPAKKRGLPGGRLIWIILLVVVIGGAGYWFLSGNKNPVPADGSAMPMAAEEPQSPVQVDELAKGTDLPPQPAPINATEETAPTGTPDVAVIENPALDVPKIPAVPPDKQLSQVDTNNTASAPAAPALQAEPAPVAAEDPLAAATDKGAAELAAKEKEMADKLAALDKSWQERFAAMEADMKAQIDAAETRAKSALAPAAPAGNDKALDALKSENEALKTQIAALTAEKNQAEAKAAEAKAAAVPPPAQKAGDLWELKSAQPDKALISQKGSAVVQSIKVGDTVPGFGKILSVKAENGIWVVTGTEGRLSR